MRHSTILLLWSFLCFAGQAQTDSEAPSTLRLQAGSFELQRFDPQSSLTDAVKQWPKAQNKHYGVIALHRFPSLEEQAVIAEQGIELLDYLPVGHYAISIAEGSDLTTLLGFGVKAASPYLPDFKTAIDPAFPPSRAIDHNGRLMLNLHGFKNIDVSALIASLSSVEIEILDVRATYGYVTVRCSEERVGQLAALPSVQHIDWAYDYGEPENYTGRSLHRTNYLSPDNNNGLNYTGSGISVMLQDDGSIGPHIDHQGRIQEQFWIPDLGNHGDHVGGTICGAGNLDPYHEGQAKGADLYVYKAAPEYQGFDSIEAHYSSYGVLITSTSYSNGCNAGYTALARTMDQQVRENASLMHVFSAGNSGTSNCGYGAGQYWGNITGGHKIGKNVMAVASLNYQDLIAGSSSRGPAHDGRIKPDVSAKGVSVESTIAGNEYAVYSGTSMACPGVSGMLAQLYEAYQELNGTLPNGGFMKALLMNTADDLGNPGPDFIYGWGRVNARKAFQMMDEGTVFAGQVASNASNSHSFSVTGQNDRLRVMVYWTDVEASTSASVALVNDIDMKLVTPSGDTLLPYLLDHTPHADSLDNPAVNGEDHLNNVEQVELHDPSNGNYQVLIDGGSIPFGPQSYYVLVFIEEPGLTLTYPVGGESMAPSVWPSPQETIRWDYNGNATTVDLDYSNDGGTSWNTIVQGANADVGYFDWAVPATQSGQYKVRISDGSETVESENFSVAFTPTGLTVGWACPDSMGLIWDAVQDAVSFDVYQLGEKYMDSIGTNTSQDFTVYGLNPYNEGHWFSVSTDGPNGAKGKRAYAITRSPGLQNCFLAKDLNATALFPLRQTVYDCFEEGLDISFIVENGGVTPVTDFKAGLYGPSGLVTEDSFSTNLSPLASDTFKFSALAILESGRQDYYLLVEMEGDANAYNDTIHKTFERVDAPAITPIWGETFDTYDLCSNASDCGFTMCDVPGGWVNASNGVVDDIDWRISTGETPTSFTGPSGDNTTAGDTGNYVYLESSGDCAYQEAHLLTPCIDLSSATTPYLSFYYNMYGATIGELHVDVFDGGEWFEDVMTPLVGFQSANWRLEEVDLSAFNGQSVVIRFRGITGSSFRSDIALDDIFIHHPPVAYFEHIPSADGQTVLFTDLSAYGDTMSFDLGDGSALLSSVPSTHVYGATQAYTVTQIVSNELGSDTFVLDLNNLSVEKLGEHSIEFYPNPTNGVLSIRSDGALLGEIIVRTLDGREVLKFQTSSSWMDIDLRNLGAGMYLISLPDLGLKGKAIVVLEE